MFNRMKKLQNPNRLKHITKEKEVEGPSKKRRKTGESWTEIPEMPMGTTLESLQNYREEKRREVMKTSNIQLQREFLEKTYPLRRHEILTNPKPVKEVLDKYPPLRKLLHVRFYVHI